jgi:hypothetical protein
MPDIKEVYEMVTQQTGPKPGALERQVAKHERRDRNRRIGAILVAAAIGVGAVLLIALDRPRTDDTAPVSPPPPTYAVDPQANAVAAGWVQAFGDFDGEQAITYLADNAYLGMNATNPGQVPIFTTFLQAMGYQQIVSEPCRVTGTSAAGTTMRCPFDWHAIRSDRLGLGPYPGHWEIDVRDGAIVSVVLTWGLKDFGPQMWEPFRDWVRVHHPKEFDRMYVDDGGDFQLTEESARLWEENSKEYVRAVQQDGAP